MQTPLQTTRGFDYRPGWILIGLGFSLRVELNSHSVLAIILVVHEAAPVILIHEANLNFGDLLTFT